MGWSAAPYRFEAIGTTWQIDLPDGLLASTRQELEQQIQERIAVFDRNYSRFRSDSLVTTISKEAGHYTLPDDAEPLFSLYEKLYRLTGGLMTPLIGSVLTAAGYDENYSLETKKMEQAPRWENTLERKGLTLEVKKPVLLDLGAAGKGYLVDLVAEIIIAAGVRSFCVDAGGDIAYYNNNGESLRIGLEHPSETEAVIGVCNLSSGSSLCGSAGNRRQWGNFHHIINPQTLLSPRHLSAVWVVAASTLLADALTTALFFVEPEVLQHEFEFEYVILGADYSIHRSKTFPAEFFLQT